MFTCTKLIIVLSKFPQVKTRSTLWDKLRLPAAAYDSIYGLKPVVLRWKNERKSCNLLFTVKLRKAEVKWQLIFSFAFSMPLCLCPSATNQLHPEPVRLPLRLRSGLRLIQGKLRRRGSRRALISNSLINSPFAPLRAAICLCRKASAVRHPVDCGLASIFYLLSSGFRAAVGCF